MEHNDIERDAFAESRGVRVFTNIAARVEDDHVEGDALAQARGMGIVANITTFILHIRRFMLVAVFYRSWGQIDGDDLYFPFSCTESGYSFREVARAAARIKNT